MYGGIRGERVAEAMNARGISTKDLANLIGCPAVDLTEVIENRREPSVVGVMMIAEALHVSVKWLIGEDEVVDVKIKYHADIEHLEKIWIGDWIDLRSAEEVELKQGDLYYISLGVSMELPEGYEAIVAPRSSTPMNFGIICASSIGIIDNSYRGDDDVWKFVAYAIRDTRIRKGDRICQFRVQKIQPKIRFFETKILGNENRGGTGSTGRN